MGEKQNKKTEKTKIGYRIGKIHSTRFSFEDISDDRCEDLFKKSESLGVNISVAMTIEKEDSSVVIDIKSELFNNVENQSLITHTGRTLYYLKGLEETYSQEKDSFDLPSNLLLQLLSIAYTHSRALLAKEISPTCYHEKYFLPIIDPRDLIDMLDLSNSKEK